MKSKFADLTKNDLVHSLIWAILFAIIGVFETSMQTGSLDIGWHSLWLAIIGAVINTVKRFLTNSDGKILKKEQ